MGIDIRVWIHKEDLKNLDLWDATKLYDLFSGRWHYGIKSRFLFQEQTNKVTLKELEEHLAYTSEVPQKSRDIVKSFTNLRLIFQMDCEDEEFEDYFDLGWFMDKSWEEAKEKIK